MTDNSWIAPYARTAFAQGWAGSGGPMTDAVKAGSIAAVQICIESADEPGILEVALHLGHLEGVWADVFARRFDLIGKYGDVLTPLWRQAVADTDIAGAIEIFRQELGLTESRDAAFIRRAKAVAREIAVRLLSWLGGKPIWQRMRDAMRAVLATARAEGYASALAIAAAEQHVLGFSFDIAFEHAYAAMMNLGQLWAESDAWLSRMLGRAADDFSRTLGNMAGLGASYEDMVGAAAEVLGMQTSSAVSFIVDWALTTGLSRGALDLYASENVQYVSWLTAGDDRVCPICEQNGQDSPYLITDFPEMPSHPLCRCVPSAELSDLSAYSAFFTS